MKNLILYAILLFNVTTKGQIVDNLGADLLNASFRTKDNELVKESDEGIFRYKNILLGNLTAVDYINPLQTLLFYKNQQTLVVLDKQFNELNTVKLNLIQPTLDVIYAGQAIQNKIWIFDMLSKKVGLLAPKDNTIALLTPTIDEQVIWMGSLTKNFYYINNKNQLMQVSIYGKITPIITLPNFEQISLNGYLLQMTDPGYGIKKLDLNTLEYKE